MARSAIPKRGATAASLALATELAYRRKDFAACIEAARACLASDPRNSQVLLICARAHLARGQPREALELLERLLASNPNNSEYRHLSATVCIQLELYDQAVGHLDFCLQVDPEDPTFAYLLCVCHEQRGRTADALKGYSNLIERKPAFIKAYLRLARLLALQGDTDQAIELLDLGCRLNEGHSDLLRLKARLMVRAGRLAAARGVYERLCTIEPIATSDRVDHANLMLMMRQFDIAEEKYKEVIAIEPNNGAALLNYGKLLFLAKRYGEALALYERYLKIYPSDVTALKNIATIYGSKRDFYSSNKYYGLAFRANPQAREVAGGYLYSMSFLCDWDSHGAVMQVIRQNPESALPQPFLSVLFTDDAALQLTNARRVMARDFSSTGIFGPAPTYPHHQKIRIGYFSSDFFNHATVMLIEGLLREHDREKFELYAFSLEPRKHDEYTERIKKLFHEYYDVSSLSDRAVTHLSRKLEIDIAIDLKGFTEGSRTAIFSERAAPIQINYLGYPGTMGSEFIDYIVADPYIINDSNRRHFSEKVIYMPDCYQPNNPNRPCAGSRATVERPEELPEGAFVYCSFNNTHKLNPDIFDSWIRILEKTENSVLWLLRTTPQAEENLLSYVRKTSVDPGRLRFAANLPEEQHLRRLIYADLFLDTFPCNAHTTASDAMWAGVPLITRSGQSFASRVAGSIMKSVGLDELVVDSLEGYEALAVKIWQDRAYQEYLRQRIVKGISGGALYDAHKYKNLFEAALIEVHERRCAGLQPEDWISILPGKAI